MEQTYMEQTIVFDGLLFSKCLRAGAANLRRHEDEVNNLNVFQIPDGDTGSNMLRTIAGGVDTLSGMEEPDLGTAARRAADGMLLSARGNSGVILSQIFDGIAEGFEGVSAADNVQIGKALHLGVKHAYDAVLEPTEGTILTVARYAAEYAQSFITKTPAEFFDSYIAEAKRTLERTPEMLAVLKRAGVVDSGGAGYVYILEGMKSAAGGEENPADIDFHAPDTHNNELNLDLFTEDSVLEFGYCTELLLRLQNRKTDPVTFDVATITDYLKTIGDSVVAFKTGSIVKIHVHTMTPDKVLAFCQQYGEFLTIKIENMSLQHNNTVPVDVNISVKEPDEMKKYGVVAVCTGSGIRQMFRDQGADVVVDGGQSMNPSTEDFIKAFDAVNAKNIVVLPNNGNVILAAQQAANMYDKKTVRVLESKTIGDGYAALSMMNPEVKNIDLLMPELRGAMEGVITAEVSPCIRDSEIDGVRLKNGDFLGIQGKKFVASAETSKEAALKTFEALCTEDNYVCILIRGCDTNEYDAVELETCIKENYPDIEVYLIDGMQEIYNYIMILQ